MLGLIHIILKDLVVKKFGADKWDLIMAELGIEDDSAILDASKQYDDATSVAGIDAVCKVLGVSWDTALEVFGAHFVGYVYEGGYGRMLKSMGDTLPEFLLNVNHMHQYLERHFRESSFPVWGVDPSDDGTFMLSYTSSRGLALKGIIKGLLEEAGLRFFNQKVKVEELDETETGFLLTMKVTLVNLPKEDQLPEPTDIDEEHRRNAGLWHQAVQSFGKTTQSNSFAEVVTEAWEKARNMCEPLPEETAAPELQAWLTTPEPPEPPQPSKEDLVYLDGLAKLVKADPSRGGDVLMRSVPAGVVGAEWKDAKSLDDARVFWETYAGDTRYFKFSKRSDRASRFVSHSWRAPSDWNEVMGKCANYAEIKATELTIVARDIVASGKYDIGSGSNDTEAWKEVPFWVDKCCIPQGHALIGEYFSRLEDFIQRSDGMVVLLSWQYFERLWCIYEWASFLIYHGATDVHLCVDAFLKPSTRTLYLETVRNFSVSNAKCDVEKDRLILQGKINEHFVSGDAFEHYVKVTAVALMALTAVRRAGRNKLEFETEYLPWVQLAKDLRMTDLAAALVRANPVAWRIESMRRGGGTDGSGKGATPWLEKYNATIDAWFQERIHPILMVVKGDCVRPEFLSEDDLYEIQDAKMCLSVPSSIVPNMSVSKSKTMSASGSQSRPTSEVRSASIARPATVDEDTQGSVPTIYSTAPAASPTAPAASLPPPRAAAAAAANLTNVALGVPENHPAIPRCPACSKPMQWSCCSTGVYATGWQCDFHMLCQAGARTVGPWRWLCQTCCHDLCQTCSFRGPPAPAPIQTAPSAAEPVRRSFLSRLTFRSGKTERSAAAHPTTFSGGTRASGPMMMHQPSQHGQPPVLLGHQRSMVAQTKA